MNQIKKAAKKVHKNWTNDKDATKKFRVHAACIAVGLVLAVGATYIGGQLIHLAPVLPVVPSFIQEAIDRLLSL